MDLMTMDKKQLVALAHQYSIPVDGRARQADIARLVAEHIAAKPQPQNAAPKPVVEAPQNTQADIEKLVAPYVAKGMDVEFLDDGNSFSFSYKGKTDTGSIHQPLARIKRTAEMVAKGVRMLPVLTGGEWDEFGKGYASKLMAGNRLGSSAGE